MIDVRVKLTFPEELVRLPLLARVVNDLTTIKPYKEYRKRFIC